MLLIYDKEECSILISRGDYMTKEAKLNSLYARKAILEARPKRNTNVIKKIERNIRIIQNKYGV